MTRKNALLIASLLVILGVLSRLMPHTWNMTPLMAISLFSTVYLGMRYSVGILLTIMVLSDLFLGSYQWEIMLSVYGSFLLAGAVGLLIRKYKSVPTVFMGAIGSSVVFFLITNWAVWQFAGMYSLTWSGLMESYTLALPFFRNSLIGDLFYTGAFFAAFEAVKYFVYKNTAKRDEHLLTVTIQN